MNNDTVEHDKKSADVMMKDDGSSDACKVVEDVVADTKEELIRKETKMHLELAWIAQRRLMRAYVKSLNQN